MSDITLGGAPEYKAVLQNEDVMISKKCLISVSTEVC